MAHFSTTRRVEFCETDLAGIVHFANYYRYMEQAEHEFFRTLGLKIAGVSASGQRYGWPRVSATCSFTAPAHYEDLIQVDLTIQRLSEKSLTVGYHFSRDSQQLAVGEMKTVFCVMSEPGKLSSAIMPEEIATRLRQAAQLPA